MDTSVITFQEPFLLGGSYVFVELVHLGMSYKGLNIAYLLSAGGLVIWVLPILSSAGALVGRLGYVGWFYMLP